MPITTVKFNANNDDFIASYYQDFETHIINVSGSTEIEYSSSSFKIELVGDFLEAPNYSYDFETTRATLKGGNRWEIYLPSGGNTQRINITINVKVKEVEQPNPVRFNIDGENVDNVKLSYLWDFETFDFLPNEDIIFPNENGRTPTVSVEYINGVVSLYPPTGIGYDSGGELVELVMDQVGGKFTYKINPNLLGVIFDLNPKGNSSSSDIENVYLMESDDLFDLSKRGWWINRFDDLPVDGSQFFINMIRYPFNIPIEDVGDRAEIKVGTYSLDGTNPQRLNNHLIRFDLGSIEIVGKYNNSLDYLGEIKVNFPYSTNFELLDIKKYMGSFLKVEYVINVIDGGVTCLLYCNGVLDIVSNINIGTSIPYKAYLDSRGVLSELGGVNGGLNCVSVEVQYPDVLEGVFSNLVTKQGSIENMNGYIEFNRVVLDGNNIPKNEYDLLINVLQNGVFKND